MKKIFSIILILCLLPIFAYSKNITYGDFNNVQYVKNYDGDTITFNIKNVHPLLGKNINIRIRGIDTPEIRSKCLYEKKLAYRAKCFVESLCKTNKKIILKNVSRGKYFRIIADVYIGNENISKLLLKYKLAVVYNGGKKISWCNNKKIFNKE